MQPNDIKALWIGVISSIIGTFIWSIITRYIIRNIQPMFTKKRRKALLIIVIYLLFSFIAPLILLYLSFFKLTGLWFWLSQVLAWSVISGFFIAIFLTIYTISITRNLKTKPAVKKKSKKNTMVNT